MKKKLIARVSEVFDWHKAAHIIHDTNPKIAVAYLKEQKNTTGGVIWKNGKPVFDNYTFLQSCWDKPMLECDGSPVECHRQADDTIPDEFWKRFDGVKVYRALGRWNYFTKWPDSALEIVGDHEDKEAK